MFASCACKVCVRFVVFLFFCSCSGINLHHQSPTPEISDLNPLKPLFVKKVDVIEISSTGKENNFSVNHESFDWYPVIRNKERCWKMSGRNCFTTDYYGWKSINDYLKKKYPAVSYSGGKLSHQKVQSRLMNITVGLTGGQIFGTMGYSGDFKESYDWGEVWFFQFTDEKFLPIVFDNTDRVTGYGQKFYEQTLSDLGTGQF